MELKDYVEKSADPWSLKSVGLDERRSFIIKKYLSNKGLVLDIGCAFGVYTDFLSHIGNKAIGIDFSGRMISEASKKYPKNLFVRADAIRLPFKSNIFDAALVMGTSIYVKNKKVLFSEISSTLKKGATICIIERNRYSLWHRLSGKRKEAVVDDISSFVSAREILVLLNDSGFKIKQVAGDMIAAPLLSQNKITRRFFWSLGETFPSMAYFVIIVAEKK